METKQLIFFVILAALAIGGPMAGIAYDKAQETKQMVACAESGQKWIVDDRTRQHECVR